MPSYSRIASGDIQKCRFVAQVGGKPFYVRPVTSNSDHPVGVSDRASFNDPGVGKFYGQTSFPAGIDGYPLRVISSPDEAILELAGTVAVGQYIKTDNTGRGVAATNLATDNVFARALESGVVGDLIRVVLIDKPVA